MTPRTAIEDMTDAQDEARAEALREAVAICRRIRAEECENDDQAIGALECALAIQDAINATASARPSQAGDERVARLIRAVECERNHKNAYDATPQDRGGHKGPKGQAYQLWMDARADVGAALAAMDTPKGGGDE